jgi:hypothetical protein
MNGSGGSVIVSGGTVGNAGAQAEGGVAVGGGAGQATFGGSAGAGSASGGSPGNASGGASSGNAGKGGAAGSAGKSGAGGSVGNGGSAGSAGKGGASGGANSGGTNTTGGVSNAGAGGQATCEAMRAELPKLLTAAQVCDVSLDRLPCTGFVSNECGCKVPVDGPSLPVAQAYVSAVAALAKCGIACPAIVCAEPTSATCQTEGTQTKGHCAAVAKQ